MDQQNLPKNCKDLIYYWIFLLLRIMDLYPDNIKSNDVFLVSISK